MALPLLLVSLSSPILSLIDVAAVGRSSGVVQLASLGPATSVCDLSMCEFPTSSRAPLLPPLPPLPQTHTPSYQLTDPPYTDVFATLSIVTTRLAAAALVEGDRSEASRRVADGLAVAAGLGLLWGAVLYSAPSARVLLSIFLPSSSSGGGVGAAAAVDSTGVLPAALAYTRVRALGFVPALATVVLQSSALVRRDVLLPLAAVTLGSVSHFAVLCVCQI